MRIIEYKREQALAYARRWALSRNPLYYDFSSIGGDCTNFISQCVFAGSKQMNYEKDKGWYYSSLTDRAPAWTGVEFFYEFITKNEGLGPFAIMVNKNQIRPADVIQLGDQNGNFYHAAIVTGIFEDEILVAAHTFDTLDRPLSTYNFNRVRYLSIQGVRTN